MTRSSDANSRWLTSSFGAQADTSPVELADLGEHLGKCRRANGRLVILQGAWTATTGFVHSRLMTTLLALAAVSVLIYLLS